MENICTTDITFHSSEEGIDWLESQVEILLEISYDERVEKFREFFGRTDANNFTDAIGSKWLNFGQNWEREDNETYTFQTESTWSFPSEMIRYIISMLLIFDNESHATGRYWDQTYSSIGVFECDTEGIRNSEKELDINTEEWENENPDGNFWNDVIEPMFYELELQLENE